jgi:TRAP-type C4-dicarboxylate transport system permease small subunit
LSDGRGRGLGAQLRRVNAFLHGTAGVTLALLMLYTVGDILGRTFFSRPFPGTVELTELAVVVLVYLGLARAEDDDAHIAVDLLYVRLGERGQLLMRAFAGAATALVIAVMTWRLIVFAQQMHSGNYTTGVLRIPLYPVVLLGVFGSAAFALAALNNLTGTLRTLVKGQ